MGAVLLVLGIVLVSHVSGQAVNDKAGTCPEVPASDRSECPPPESQIGSCLIDSDCEGTGQKCCSDGCNLICMAAKQPPQTEKGRPGPPGPPGEAGAAGRQGIGGR